MSEPSITVYGAFWCPDCHRSKMFLGEHQIPYNWVDIEEDGDGEKFVIEANAGKRRIPTLAFDDGTILSNPTNAELAAKLGLKTTSERHHYDLIIIGGGPAGLTAGLYTAREGVETLVIERAALGGQAASTMNLDNVPGFPEGVGGAELSRRLRAQAERFGVEILQAQQVEGVDRRDNFNCVMLADGTELSAAAILIASGSRYRRLNIPGEESYIGAGVHFCATCDGPFYKGQTVAVIGGGNSAAEESIFLTRFAERVCLLVRGPSLAASKIIQEQVLNHSKVDVRFNTVVTSFEGAASKLRSLEIRNVLTGVEETLELPAAFVFVGLDPNTGFLANGAVQLDKWGFVETGHQLVHEGDRPPGFEDTEPAILETSVPGIFAAGDVRAGSTKQVASATGEGAAAALMIRDYLRTV